MQGLYENTYMSPLIRKGLLDLLMHLFQLAASVGPLVSLTHPLLEGLDSVIASVIDVRLLSPIASGASPAGTALDEHATSATTCLKLLAAVLSVSSDTQAPNCHRLAAKAIAQSVDRLSAGVLRTSTAATVASSLEVRLRWFQTPVGFPPRFCVELDHPCSYRSLKPCITLLCCVHM
jgi:hypothetical protein